MKRVLITALAISSVFSLALARPAESDDKYFESKFDGVWAGYLELEGIEFPLLANLNAQKAASTGFVFFIAGDENAEDFKLKPYPISGVKIKPNKVSFEFDAFKWGRDDAEYESKIFDLTLKYNAKKGCLSGKFSFVDPESEETVKGSVLLYRLDESKPVQNLWQGYLPDLTDENAPIFLFLTQNSPVDGSLLLMPKHTPFKNGNFNNNVLTGSLEVTLEGNVKKDLDLDLNYNNNRLDGTAGIKIIRGKSITVDATLLPAGAKGKIVKINSVKPQSAAAGSEINVTIRGSNFADGAVVHANNEKVGVFDIQFKSSSKLLTTLKMPNKIKAGSKIGIRVVNADNQRADKNEAITIK